MDLENFEAEEKLPERIARRIRINEPIDCPTSDCGALILDYDKDGRIIDKFYEGLRNPNVKVYEPKVYAPQVYDSEMRFFW